MNWYIKVLQNYALFSGRARRTEYWMFVLINFIISIVLTVVDSMIFSPYEPQWINTLYSLAVLLPSIAVAVRRMHDVGKSGWYILIPIYNIILAATEGDQGPNEYGEDPKNERNQSDDLLDDYLISK